ncbi:hypothetical protein CEJ64_16865, partial [Acinetobacter baumannii]
AIESIEPGFSLTICLLKSVIGAAIAEPDIKQILLNKIFNKELLFLIKGLLLYYLHYIYLNNQFIKYKLP